MIRGGNGTANYDVLAIHELIPGDFQFNMFVGLRSIPWSEKTELHLLL